LFFFIHCQQTLDRFGFQVDHPPSLWCAGGFPDGSGTGPGQVIFPSCPIRWKEADAPLMGNVASYPFRENYSQKYNKKDLFYGATVTVPRMNGWMLHMYMYVPVRLNVNWNVFP
jgi:hypothetical protein